MSERADRKPKTIKIPGPDHPIAIERNARRIVVAVAGRVVADTRAALTLREASYPPVQYIPRKDVDTALLERTDHATYCPYKGDCAYYSIPGGRSVLGRGYHHAGYRRLRDASLRHAHSRRLRRAQALVRRRLGSSECGGLAATDGGCDGRPR